MLYIAKTVEYPAHLKKLYQRAVLYEWISFLYMISASIFSFLAMSSSQTMKTVWLEDLLGIVPPASFLIASRIIRKRPTKNFQYGFHRSVGIAFLTGSLALFILGAYLLIDGTIVLLKQEHIHLSWSQIYLMLAALIWSSLPSTILGHIKIPLAKQLYDKVLFTDSKMNRASWMSGFASIIGVVGIGFGFWWADATVAIIISFDILYDGFNNLKQAIQDLLSEIPKTIDETETDPLIAEVKALIAKEDWLQSFQVRFRDEGHVFFGEVFIEPKDNSVPINKITELREKIQNYHWRLIDIVVMPFKNENI